MAGENMDQLTTTIPMENTTKTGSLVLHGMRVRNSSGRTTSRIAISELMLKTAWIISKWKYVAHSR